MKTTAVAPSNIAFIKYWGKKDEKLKLPTNGSVSMNLSNLFTTTTVDFNKDLKRDQITIDGIEDRKIILRVVEHLNRMRKLAKKNTYAKVISKNNFPMSTGLSSSASGFAALTLAATKAIGLNLSEKELSLLTRQGSGSACRSIPDGFVEWKEGDSDKDSYAISIFPRDYWNILDVVVIISQEKKAISSSEGQRVVMTSPFFKERLNHINEKIKLCKKFLTTRNFSLFGNLIEKEALEMHAVMITSSPPLIYWQPSTLLLMKLVQDWRAAGLEVYFTINTGQDVHLIIEDKHLSRLLMLLEKQSFIKKIVVNKPALGSRIISSHLF